MKRIKQIKEELAILNKQLAELRRVQSWGSWYDYYTYQERIDEVRLTIHELEKELKVLIKTIK